MVLKDAVPADATLEAYLADSTTFFRVLDGNHRTGAMQNIDKREGTDTKIMVEVHSPMPASVERMVCEGELAFCSGERECRCGALGTSHVLRVVKLLFCKKRRPGSTWLALFSPRCTPSNHTHCLVGGNPTLNPLAL